MWAQLANAAIGIWLMGAPAVLGYVGSAAAVSDRVAGPCIAALAGVAVGGCTRGVRWWLLPFALWLLVAPFALAAPGPAAMNSVACGLAVASLSLVRGRVQGRFGGGWTVLLRGTNKLDGERGTQES